VVPVRSTDAVNVGRWAVENRAAERYILSMEQEHEVTAKSSDPQSGGERRSPRRQLSLIDATLVIVGIIIGAAIYESTPLIAACAGGPWRLLGMWLLGGVLALCGALCYAELATAYPRFGGDYYFLKRAYGRGTGFLFAWVEYWIIRPGNIGAMAYVFARYASELVALPAALRSQQFTIYAAAAIIVLTAIHVLGVRTGTRTQNVLTAAKVIGLLMVFLVGLLLVSPADTASAAPATTPPPMGVNFSLALIFVMFTFGGWNEMSFVAAEVREPRKNIIGALLLGTVGITLIYLLVNVAFLRALGYEGIVQSQAIATDMVNKYSPTWGATAISVLICVSALGAVHGMIFTGARIIFALGRDFPSLGWLGRWHGGLDTPLFALALQAALAVLLVWLFGPNRDAFDKLVIYTTPFFWAFLVLVAVSLFVLRRNDPHTERPFKVPFFPVIPLVFALSSLWMCYRGIIYAVAQKDWVEEVAYACGVLVVGVAVMVVLLLRAAPAAENESDSADSSK